MDCNIGYSQWFWFLRYLHYQNKEEYIIKESQNKMNTQELANQSVGAIVAQRFSSAEVFAKYGIDFCCHGDALLSDACQAAGVQLDEVLKALSAPEQQGGANVEFATWPLDLIMDYVLKIHHRGIRVKGPQTLELLNKVVNVHGEHHPELFEVKALFLESLQELEMHLQKEENVLFPYLYELCEAAEKQRPIEQMHCGSIENPIRVMRMEHEGEGNRYHYMAKITNNFTAPADACDSYRLVYRQINDFVNALYEHIHLENNIIFPQAVELEAQWVR